MGRAIITNDELCLMQIYKKEKSQGFSLNKKIVDKNIISNWYFKKRSNIDNTYQIGNDYCCCVGGLIFNNRTGKEALSGIYEAYNGDIDKLRKSIIGNYCLVIRKNNRIVIFVDKYHVYSMYYQLDNKKIFLSSDILDVMLWHGNYNISESNLLLTSFQCACVGNETFVEGIHKLLGREYIEIDLISDELTIKDISYSRSHRKYYSIEEAATTIADAIRQQYEKVSRTFGDSVGINMTGGLDSRTILAGCLSAGIKPQLLHAQSNCQSVVGTEKGDEQCVLNISQKYGLNFLRLNWNCNYPDDFKMWDELFFKYGFDFKFYGGNSNFYNSYENIDGVYPAFMETGLYGECIRIREQYSNRKKDFPTIEDFISEYQLEGTHSRYIANEEFCIHSDNIKKYFIKRYKDELGAFGLNPDGAISMDAFEEVRYIHQRGTDGVLINFLSQYTTCFSVLSTEQVCENIYDACSEYRSYAKLQLRVIEALNADLIDIPFFSHRSKCIVDKEKYTLIRPLTFNEKCGSVLRNMGLRNSLFYIILQKVKNYLLRNDWRVQRNIKHSDEVLHLIPVIRKIIEKDELTVGRYVNTEHIPNDDSIVHLIYYAMHLHGITLLKDNKLYYCND